MSTATVNITEFLEQNPTVSGREAARRLNVHESAIRRAKMTKTETAKKSTLKTLKVKDLILDPECQPRLEMNQETIDDYVEAMQHADKFPPVDVFFDGSLYWVADGFSRVSAAIQAGIKTFEANVFEGSKRDAVLYSKGVNRTHGQRRTNADKRSSVESLLSDPEWGGWADRRIAEHCGVSDFLVRSIRHDLAPPEGNQDSDINCEILAVDITQSSRMGADGKIRKVPSKAKSSSPASTNGKHAEPTNGHATETVTIAPSRERDPGDDDEETEVDGYIAEDVEGEFIPTTPQPTEEERFLASLPLSTVLKGRSLETFHREALRFRKARAAVDTMKALGLSAGPKAGDVLGPFTWAVGKVVRFQYPNAWGKCLTCEGRGDTGCTTCYGTGFVAK